MFMTGHELSRRNIEIILLLFNKLSSYVCKLPLGYTRLTDE
jgi:hypothetical protein